MLRRRTFQKILDRFKDFQEQVQNFAARRTALSKNLRVFSRIQAASPTNPGSPSAGLPTIADGAASPSGASRKKMKRAGISGSMTDVQEKWKKAGNAAVFTARVKRSASISAAANQVTDIYKEAAAEGGQRGSLIDSHGGGSSAPGGHEDEGRPNHADGEDDSPVRSSSLIATHGQRNSPKVNVDDMRVARYSNDDTSNSPSPRARLE